MNREIKFRAWDKELKEMVPPKKIMCGQLGMLIDTDREWTDVSYSMDRFEIMQFTGKKGFNDNDLYKGDIVFYEESEEDGDKRYYLVITWIPEWSMFASLHVDEYKKYIEFGIEELDEPLFWTYTLEVSDYFHYAGNIYENPELLLSHPNSKETKQ